MFKEGSPNPGTDPVFSVGKSGELGVICPGLGAGARNSTREGKALAARGSPAPLTQPTVLNPQDRHRALVQATRYTSTTNLHCFQFKVAVDVRNRKMHSPTQRDHLIYCVGSPIKQTLKEVTE